MPGHTEPVPNRSSPPTRSSSRTQDEEAPNCARRPGADAMASPHPTPPSNTRREVGPSRRRAVALARQRPRGGAGRPAPAGGASLLSLEEAPLVCVAHNPARQARSPAPRKLARTCDNPSRARFCRKRLGLVHLRARSRELRALAVVSGAAYAIGQNRAGGLATRDVPPRAQPAGAPRRRAAAEGPSAPSVVGGRTKRAAAKHHDTARATGELSRFLRFKVIANIAAAGSSYLRHFIL